MSVCSDARARFVLLGIELLLRGFAIVNPSNKYILFVSFVRCTSLARKAA